MPKGARVFALKSLLDSAVTGGNAGPQDRWMTGMGFSFPKQARLLKTSDFAGNWRHARRLKGNGLLVVVRKNTQGDARLGIIVGKKQFKRAVDRNRIKRLVRESFRHRRETLGAVDLIVIAKKPLLQECNGEILQRLEALWARLIASYHNSC